MSSKGELKWLLVSSLGLSERELAIIGAQVSTIIEEKSGKTFGFEVHNTYTLGQRCCNVSAPKT